jgi:hypothetical protein
MSLYTESIIALNVSTSSHAAKRSAWNDLCTPGTGVNLWGASPLYENHGNTSTSPRQGRKGDRPSEGSLRQTCEPTNRNRIQGSVPGQVSTT